MKHDTVYMEYEFNRVPTNALIKCNYISQGFNSQPYFWKIYTTGSIWMRHTIQLIQDSGLQKYWQDMSNRLLVLSWNMYQVRRPAMFTDDIDFYKLQFVIYMLIVLYSGAFFIFWLEFGLITRIKYKLLDVYLVVHHSLKIWSSIFLFVPQCLAKFTTNSRFPILFLPKSNNLRLYVSKLLFTKK